MFNKKKYHREYMQEYRKTHFLSDKQIIKRREAVKKHNRHKRKTDPKWVEEQRKRGREYGKKRRETDPEWKRLCYQKHTEWARKNRAHINAKQREYNKKPEYKLKARIRNLKKVYGLSHEEYLAKIKDQNNKCPICSKELANGYVDHNHKTGQIRDLLCNECNRWIGFVEKYPHLISPMLDYLKKWNY